MGSHKSRKEKHKKSKKSKSRSYDHDEEQDDFSRPVETGGRMDIDYQTSERLSRTTETERTYKQERPFVTESESPASAPNSSQRDGGDVALSIEETNRLRAKLGLKPLQTGGQSRSGGQESESVSYEDRADVHAPASNLSSAVTTKKLRDRVEDSKEKRRISKKLNKIQSLGAADFDNERETTESASDWVRKMRENEIQKEMANKRAKMLEEIEQDFGISDVMMEEVNRAGRKPTAPKYSRKDLAGFRIEHKSKEFKEGSTVIVTLKDQDVLGEGEDVLENVNMIDDRKAAMNIENRKRKPDYVPYEDEEDAAEMPKFRGILKKYDKDENESEFFRLDHTGNADDEDEKELEMIRRNLMAQQQSLEYAAPKIGMDYYTTEEMVKFKKPGKKRRKIRKKEMVKADDLLPLEEYSKIDYGSRKSQGKVMEDRRQQEIPSKLEKLEFPDAEVQENDDADMELQIALERSRNANIKKRQPLPLQLPKEEPNDDALEFTSPVEKRRSKGAIVLDSTSEFCRTLGEDNAFDAAVQEVKSTESAVSDVSMDMETIGGGWEQVNTDSGKKQKKETQKHEAVLEEEPDLKLGLAAALKVASNKGLIDAKKKKTNAFQALNLPDSKAVIDEDKMRDEMRERYHRHDPYGFKEKEKYKPDVKLEYIDQHGRQLSEKEAFRFLSHRFHGKGSGKMKTEKRAKKMTEEMKLKNMSAIDTPLNTMQMMSERQQLSQTPYVVLSGGGKNLLTTNIISKK